MSKSITIEHDFPSLAERAYAQLKQMIFDFSFMPGDLLSEGELSKDVAVSRTPLRQALQRLQHEGFVIAMPKIGWQVAPLDFNKLDELYDFRILIETHAVKCLCESDRSSPIFEELMKFWCVAKSKRSNDGVLVGRRDEEFHSQLVHAAGNNEMLKMHTEITERIRIVRRLDFTKQQRVNETYDEHSLILQAILKGRSAEAQRLLRAHIEQSKIEVRKITLGMLHEAKQSNKAR
jgi:DNA-binding GntR family transcriptional regulator